MLREAILRAYYAHQGLEVFKCLEQLDHAQQLSQPAYDALVQQRLGDALEHAVAKVPYYRALGARHLDQFPVLSKRLIWENLAQLQADGSAPLDSPSADAVMVTTSGSSGRRLKVFADMLAQEWGLAVSWFGETWPGLPGQAATSLTAGTAYLWGASDLRSTERDAWRKRLRFKLRNEQQFHCYTLNRDDVRAYHPVISRMQPARLIGYTSNLLRFAQYALELGLPPLTANKVVPTAEQLDPASREIIRAYFKAPLRERYGGREIGGIAAQCEYGRWHLFSLHVYPEVLRDDGTIAQHGSGQLLLTKLCNRRMPLIRYNIEDRVVIPPPGASPCPCGRPFPLMDELQGREIDLVRFADGTTLHGLAVAEAFRGSQAEQFLFIQEGPEQARLLVVPRPGFDDVALEQVRHKLLTRFEGRLPVSASLVPEIPRELSDPGGSGKRLHIINAWWRAQQSHE